ncbi:g11816 [Coccomyxa elongata]
MSFPRNVSPLAQRIRYDIENLFRHQYVHHPVYFRETDFKPGSFIYNNKERADEMLYFVKESGRLLDNILLKWKAERDYIKYQEWLGLHKLEITVRSWDLTKPERKALEAWGAAF